MSKKNTSFISTLILFVLIANQQLFSKTLNNSNFPNQVVYKVVKNKKVAGTTILRFTETQKLFLLTISNVNCLNLSYKDKMVTYIHKKDLKLYSSMLVQGKKILQELRLKQVSGLLDDAYIPLYKDMNTKIDTYPSITEDGTGYKYVDLLSSFIVLSNKIYTENYEMERFNLFIGKHKYVVISIIERNFPFKFKNENINVTKILLRYNFVSTENQKKESIDLVEFYIFNDRKNDLWFPVSVKIYNADRITCQLLADKYL